MDIGQFIRIPHTVLYDSRLSDKAKLVYGMILSLSMKMGYCSALNGYFAGKLGCDSSTITKAISSLIKLGYIHIDNPNSFRRTICIEYESLELRDSINPEAVDTADNASVTSTSSMINDTKVTKKETTDKPKNTSKEEEANKSKSPYPFSPEKAAELRGMLDNAEVFAFRIRLREFFTLFQDQSIYSIDSMLEQMADWTEISPKTCALLNENTFDKFLCQCLLNVLEYKSGLLKPKKRESRHYLNTEGFEIRAEHFADMIRKLLDLDLNDRANSSLLGQRYRISIDD